MKEYQIIWDLSERAVSYVEADCLGEAVRKAQAGKDYGYDTLDGSYSGVISSVSSADGKETLDVE